MKILLLEHPRRIARARCNDIANTPLSSCLITGYAAGLLTERGHEVNIVEGYLDNLSYDQIHRLAGAFGPDLTCVHMVYHWEPDRELFAFLKKLKDQGVTHLISAYGFYPTFAFEELLRQCPAIDAVVLGEPEHTLAQLAEKTRSGAHFEEIPGLAWRELSGSVRAQRREPVADLDLLPFPVRTEAMLRLPEVNLEGSRGCYGGCTFCYINPFYGMGTHLLKPGDSLIDRNVPDYYGMGTHLPDKTGFGGRRNVPDSVEWGHGRWRGRSPENIAAEIDGLLLNYGKRDFYFVDPNFFGPGRQGQDRALRLASLLKERHIRFGIEARVNDIRDQTVGALVEAGLRHILVGLESGRDESLKRLNKMTTVAQNERALSILRQHGIEPNVGFIMFEPDSTLADIRTNFEFLQSNDLLKDLPVTANVLYHPLIILQGTRAYRQLQGEGRLRLLSTSYEGTAGFADRQAASLAQIMSGITNYLFMRMEGIWSGKDKEPENARDVYRALNNVLINCFTEALECLESGKQLSSPDITAIIGEAEQEIQKYI